MSVVIIGTGISGLTAARDLSRRKVRVELVEAMPRIGGRIHTISLGTRNYDMGASWLHEVGHNVLYPMAVSSGWNLHFDDNKFVYYYSDGTTASEADFITADTVQNELAKMGDNDKDVSLRDAVNTKAPLLRGLELWSGMSWEDMSARDVGQWTSHSPTAADDSGRNRDAFNLTGNNSVIDWLRDSIDWRFVNLRLNTPVHHIQRLKNGSFTVNIGNSTLYTGWVVCTIPLGYLVEHHTELIPFEINPSLRHAMSTGVMAALGKVVLEFEQAFWDVSCDRMCVLTDPPVFFTNAFKALQKGPPTIIALVSPPLTQAIESQPGRAFELLMPALALIAQKNRTVPAPTRIIPTAWTTNPYFLGSYSGIKVGQTMQEVIQPFEEGDGRLRFAGEHTIEYGSGCMHGAYASGQREANHIIQHEAKF